MLLTMRRKWSIPGEALIYLTPVTEPLVNHKQCPMENDGGPLMVTLSQHAIIAGQWIA